ncbi:MAG: SpoIIE family protein phosphatase [Chloroflexota bacterium]
MTTDDQQPVIEELKTLKEIAVTLNQAADLRAALERSLTRLVTLMGLETGWIFLHDPRAEDKWWGPQFTLAAHHNLPPALDLDNPEAWHKGCDCQALCLKGKLDEAYNEVHCSRLGEASGDKEELVVHASTPLRSGDTVVGILNVAAPSWDSFSPRSLTLLSSVGSQMGVAVERARLYDLLRDQRLHEQAALLDFSNQLLGRLDLDDLMDYLVQAVRDLLQVDAAALLLPDEQDPAYLRFAAASGWRSDPVRAQRRVPADERSSSGRVMRTQEPIMHADIEIRELKPWMADWLPQETFKAACVTPLVADGRSIGALVVDSREPRHLAENEIRFLQLMANQAAIAMEKARLHREEIQRHRLEEELAVARQIQLSMLPPGEPQAEGWEFGMHYEAARQVGGDFYDFFELPDSNATAQLALVVADVADKGVPAALFMALSRTMIRSVAISDRSPATALSRANDLILNDSQTDLFLTAFYAALDVESGRMVYSNAGHNPPLWYRSQEQSFQELSTDGIALGVISDITLEDALIEVAAGDLLVFYTDGVTEAMNADLKEFGVERLKSAIAGAAADSAAEVRDAVVAAVDAYTGDAPRWDDFTLLVARRSDVKQAG